MNPVALLLVSLLATSPVQALEPLPPGPAMSADDPREHSVLPALFTSDPPAMLEDAAWETLKSPMLIGSTSILSTTGTFGGQLCVGGLFQQAGTTDARYVASWDGTRWQAVGTPPVAVAALQEWNGQLWAAGDQSNRVSLLRWNGATWDSMGIASTANGVDQLVVYQGELVAVGNFVKLNGDTMNHIARFDGSSWHRLGAGLPAAPSSTAEVVPIGNRLYVPGNSTNPVRCWDGTSWTTPMNGIVSSGVPSSMATDGTNLYVLGTFVMAGFGSQIVLFRYDGTSWSEVGTRNAVRSSGLAFHDGALYATRVNPDGFVVRWDGANWMSMGDSLGPTSPNRLRSSGGKLVAIGPTNIGVHAATGLALFDGVSWTPAIEPWAPDMLGTSYWTTDAAVRHDTLLVVGGYRYMADGDRMLTVSGMCAYDGAHWRSMGTANAFGGQYNKTVTVVGDDAIVGCVWLQVNSNVLRWNGAAFSTLPTGIDWGCYDAIEYQGALHVGGDFSVQPGVARLDGASWAGLGTGLNGPAGIFSVYAGRLIAGGHFATAGGASAANIAAWDGTSWYPLGAGLSGGSFPQCFALTVWNGDLVAGGDFATAGGQPAAGAARWDGSQWHAMGDNAIVVYDFAELDGILFAAGRFLVDGVARNSVARWTGTTWKLMGSGASSGAFWWLRAWRGDLWTGGQFTRAFGKNAAFMARLPNAATLGVEPMPRSTELKLSASPNPGGPRTTLRWSQGVAGRARLTVHDLAGRLVATLADGHMDVGQHSVTWESAAPAGVYFARLETGGYVSTVRLARVF